MLIDPKMFILIHVVLSLAGLFTGLIAVGGLIAGMRFSRWIAVFLTTTLLTSLTGFGFPTETVMPAHIIGAMALLALCGAMAALYWKQLKGGWRSTFAVLGVLALYLNAFVLLAQLFRKIPAVAFLMSSSPLPLFVIIQTLLLVTFIGLGWAAVKGFSIRLE